MLHDEKPCIGVLKVASPYSHHIFPFIVDHRIRCLARTVGEPFESSFVVSFRTVLCQVSILAQKALHSADADLGLGHKGRRNSANGYTPFDGNQHARYCARSERTQDIV